MRFTFRLASVAFATSAIAAPVAAPTTAFAQSTPVQSGNAPQDSVYEGDHLSVGAGVIYGPSYDGSDDYVASPVPLVQGNLKGVAIMPRPGGVALDVIQDGENPRVGFALGPVATYSRNRASQIKDPVVRAAGKLKDAIEVGASGGVTYYRLLHPFDSLTLSADMKWDINGAHSGQTISPALTYFTPLNRGLLVSVSVSARHVDDDYADYYYSVSPTQSAASGLPQFQGSGGWDSWSTGLFAAYDLNGNALDGGFAIVAIGAYSRMMNDGKRTPYTSLRGDANQWSGALGIGYTF